MSSIGAIAGAQANQSQAGQPSAEVVLNSTGTVLRMDLIKPDDVRAREKFIPVTVHALIDRLADPAAWPGGQAKSARKLFRYLDYWRRQQYGASLIDLLQTYEPFSPDTDLLITREFSEDERKAMQRRVVDQMAQLLTQANYVRIDPSHVELILTKESHYGLDLHVDFTAFEECLIFYRGASTKRDQRRRLRKFYRKEEFDVPIFQRLFLLFKLKPFDVRVREVMVEQKLDRPEAERLVRKLRTLLPDSVKESNIYMKLFKNIPRSDVEMVFPNTRVKFRLFDKIKLGLTGGGALGAGVFGTAGKIAAGGLAATNPVALAGAVAGLGGVAFRQAMNFVNQKNRYMVVMAQNLYFHSMADNRGVIIKLADRAAEEDVKEEMMLYSVLAKERARRSDLPAIDAAIEQYLVSSFGVNVDFDLEDALNRLIADGLVAERSDGVLETLPPREAALHLDKLWDAFLDNLPDLGEAEEGREVDGTSPPPQS
jgi:hypothetical protein